MARLFYTGFETGTAEWNGITSASVDIVSTVKRTGVYSCRFQYSSASASIFRQVFDSNQTELYGRFALRTTSASSIHDWRILAFHDVDNSRQCEIRYDAGTQTLDIFDGNNVMKALGNVLIPTDTWIVVEWYLLVGTSGQLTVKINGTTDATWSGDTDYSNAGNVRSVYFGPQPTAGSNVQINYVYIDDVAINNTDGAYEASWAGLGGVFYLKPNAEGAQNDWTPSAGTVNYAMVDETPSDNATTFNQALDSGDIDLYELDDCPEYIAEINCLQVAYRAALVTSGYNELTDLVRVGTVNYSGTEYTIVPLTPSFAYYLGTIHYLNPSSGSVWGTVEVNAMQAGMEITT
jgi:hypothetical protein